ncbi:MAG: hypothetical protein HZB59_13915 [Ignavibacteriales bacterium]|nr:hypothetical protein [Ignavibacteriales bacterium]
MTNGAVIAAVIAEAEAIKASGAIVRIAEKDFQSIVTKSEKPLVLVSEFTFFGKHYKYLTGYKGFVFYTKSRTPLDFGSNVELMTAKSIWIPS